MSHSLRATTDRIARDLEAGVISPKAPRPEIIARYGHGPKPESCWYDFIRALRILGEERGTIAFVDDKRDIFLTAMDCTPETSEDSVIAYCDPILRQHLRNMGNAPTRVTMYRLPRGDYSGEKTAFFEERAEYLLEANGGRD